MKIQILKYLGELAVCVLLILNLTACDTEPPVEPDAPVIIACNVSGDVTLDYKATKGVINILSGQVYQVQFSTKATINNESYAMLISVFPKNMIDTSGVFTVVEPGNNSVKENYAIVLFFTGYDTKNQKEFWGTSGTVDLSEMIIGKTKLFLKGNFNFEATYKGTDTMNVSVSEGWIDYYRKY
ncbi:MAG: hypothetical protein V1779_06275 [bacterium]